MSYIALLLLAIGMLQPAFAAKHSPHSSHAKQRCCNKVLCEIKNIERRLKSSCMIIDQNSIDRAGGTLKLKKSGEYCVVEDVQGTILIGASNISIDLLSHTIYANGRSNAIVIGSSVTPSIVAAKPVQSKQVATFTEIAKEDGDLKKWTALQVSDDFFESRSAKAKDAIANFESTCTVHNIEVFNGTVANSTLAGILINGGCDVYLHDLEFFNNNLDGMQVINSQDLHLERAAFATGNSAINIDGLNQGTLSEITIYDHTATTDNLVTIQNTDGLNLVDINATGNSKVAPANVIRYSTRGFFAIWDSVNFTIKNLNLSSSTIDNTQAAPTIFYGLYLRGSNNGFFQNFQFNTSQTIGNPINFFGTPLSAFGCFGALSFCENITILDSTVNDNLFLAPDDAYSGYIGFSVGAGVITGKDWRFERCQVNRNQGNLSTGWLLGDSGNDAGNATVIDCQFNDNIHDVMLFMRGISYESGEAGSKVLTVENFQANRNIVNDVDPSVFPDTEAILTFPYNNCITCKNIQFNYNQISHVIEFATLNIYNNVVHAEGIECNNNTIGTIFNGGNVAAIFSVEGANQKYSDIQCNQNLVQKGHEAGPAQAWFGGVIAYAAPQMEIASLQCIDNHIQGPTDNSRVAGVIYSWGSDLKISDSFIAKNSGGAETTCAGIYVEASSNIVIDGNELIETGVKNLSTNLLVVTDPPVISPIVALLAGYSPSFVPTSGVGDFADPLQACTALSNNLTNKIGIAQRGSCTFVTKTADVEAAGAVGTIIINTTGAPFVMTGPATGSYPSVMISTADGEALTDAITNNPGLILSIIDPASSSPNSFGIYFDEVSNSKIIRTEALSNLKDGFHLTETCYNCIVENCHAMGNQGSGFVDDSNFQNSYFGNKAQANTDPQYIGIAPGNISTYNRTTGAFSPAQVSSLNNIDILSLP